MVDIHWNLDKVARLEHMVEAKHTPGTMDNPGEVENQFFAEHNLQQVCSRVLVDSSPPETDKYGADNQDIVDKVDARAGREVLLRDAEQETRIRVRDRMFVDQQVSLAQ
jgi:hypothetical protein